MKECNFCGRRKPHVAAAEICRNCAAGSNRDSWCDFCKKTANTSIAFICRDCAKGREGDQWCDFCKHTTTTEPARVCQRCSA